MNFITEDMLEELASPSRLFRANSTASHTTKKAQVMDRFLTKSLLSKRESMCFDDFSHSPKLEPDRFFIETVAVQETCESKKNGEKSQLTISTEVRIVEKQEAREPEERFGQDFKENLVSSVGKEKIQVESLDLQAATTLQTDQSGSTLHRESSPLVQTKAVVNNSKFFETENTKISPQVDAPNRKASKCELDLQNSQLMRKRKPSTVNSERNLIRSRVNKVSTFWKGENTYMPGVFRTLSIVRGANKCLVEFQDFSLKGLNHNGDGLNEDSQEIKAESKNEAVDDEYFYDDFDGAGSNFGTRYLP